MPSYTVKPGDTLWGIAQSQLGNGANWQQLGFTGDPKSLQAGTTLSWGNAPAAATPSAAPAAPAPAATSGAPDAGNQSLTDFASGTANQRNDLIAKQNAQEQALIDKYKTAVTGQESLTGAYDRLTKEAGLDTLGESISTFKNQLYKVKQQLSDLDTNVTDRTKGSFTTEAQRQRQVTAEGVPLNKAISDLGMALQPQLEAFTAGSNMVNTKIGLLSEDQKRQLEPIKLELDRFSDRAAREISGFNSNKELELNALTDKITRGRQLDDREYETAQQLLSEEREFKRQKELIGIEFNNNKTLQAMKQAADSNGSASITKLIEEKRKALQIGTGSNTVKDVGGVKVYPDNYVGPLPAGAVRESEVLSSIFGGGKLTPIGKSGAGSW
jgi:murein DD-endopeptidase MepM/ murein hydrolase activator NlpD